MSAGRFQITCNFCGGFYHGNAANKLSKMPPKDTFVRASVPLCPACVDNPERIEDVKRRVKARVGIISLLAVERRCCKDEHG